MNKRKGTRVKTISTDKIPLPAVSIYQDPTGLLPDSTEVP